MMSALRCALLTLLAFFAASCGRHSDIHWNDGNFVVYALDTDFSVITLGYDHHPGILGLVNAQVVAAGSNAQWVFVARADQLSGSTVYYLIPKEGMPESHSGKVEGPFSAIQFQELKTARQLPDFSWRLGK